MAKAAVQTAVQRAIPRATRRQRAAATRAGIATAKARIKTLAGAVARRASTASPLAKKAAKASVVAAAGAAAFGITRKSPLGGKVGDAIVKKHFEKKERDEAARMAAFRAALAAERARGPVSAARVRELARLHGFQG